MTHNNIIHPLKHPYISPKVFFEEMDGDGMICGSLTAGDEGMGTDPDDTTTPTDSIQDPIDPWQTSSKSSYFDDDSDFIF